MLAFVNGMYRLTEASGNPGNVMILSDGATDELFSNLGYGDVEKLPRDVRGVLQDVTFPAASSDMEVAVGLAIFR